MFISHSQSCVFVAPVTDALSMYHTTLFHFTSSTKLMYVAMFAFSGAVQNSMLLVPDVSVVDNPFNTSVYVYVRNYVCLSQFFILLKSCCPMTVW